MSDEKINEETYSLIYSSLKHPIRRKILRMLEERELTLSEILEALAIDSGHLSYHLENLGDLVTHLAEGKYRLSTFGAAVKLMSGVEEKPKTNAKLKNRGGTFLKAFSVGLAVILLVVSFYSVFFTSSYNGNFADQSSPPFVLAQGQAFSYPVNFTDSAEPALGILTFNVFNRSESPTLTSMIIYDEQRGFVRTSEEGAKFVDTKYGNCLDIMTKYRLSLGANGNQTEFTLGVKVYDDIGQELFSTQHKSSYSLIYNVGLNEIAHLGTYRIEITNIGTEPINVSVNLRVREVQVQKPLFYYGLAGSTASIMYVGITAVAWLWTKKPKRKTT